MGDSSTGKTSIILRFCEDYFESSYKQTIGVDFFQKKIELPKDVQVTLQIWDLGGESLSSKMTSTYIFQSNAVSYLIKLMNLGYICLRRLRRADFYQPRRLV